MKTKYPNLAASHANNAKDKGDATQWITGIAHKYSKNINFIASYKQVDAKESTAAQSATIGDQLDKKTYMFTTEVTW
jgi:predicted porin